MEVIVSASIVLYNSDDVVCKAIASLLKAKIGLKLFLVDNSPTRALETKLAAFINNPQVEYIYNNANVGFGAAHNIAIKKSIPFAKYHLVINPDIYFEEGVVEALYAYMEINKEVGHVMPKILYPDNTVQYVAKLIPSPIDLLARRFLPSFVFKKRNKTLQLECSGYNQVFEAPYLSGCFMFLRMAALNEVGLFDERFFMYPEDIDLTRRIHKKFKTVFYPAVYVYHEHGKGSYKSMKMLWIHTVNIIKYFNKWGWFNDTEKRSINKATLGQFN
ncbi:glycosyltransferase family 2 protein [Parasediminibacterium sp. JCM 36343]|uniref:glycosyltransferase family 2 protein n=1 Tax=Parasediminibacterium sp. JCM 36343 TaxID=3374279 RepID=UPI003979DACA